MSTRYVWKKSTIRLLNDTIAPYLTTYTVKDASKGCYACSSYTRTNRSPTGTVISPSGTSTFLCFTTNKSGTVSGCRNVIWNEDNYGHLLEIESGDEWTYEYNRNTNKVTVKPTTSNAWHFKVVQRADEFIEYVSSATSTQYPNNDALYDYYYSEKIATYIDPTSVIYSNNEPEDGETITVSLTPRENSYGTVYYQYQYQVDGGSWTDSGSKTTETSTSITIPKGASSFRARVQTSDNMGFTSTDYVYGSTIAVQNLTAYIGVGDKAREIDKMYIGVNGVAREVVAAFVGVNGVARELF